MVEWAFGAFNFWAASGGYFYFENLRVGAYDSMRFSMAGP